MLTYAQNKEDVFLARIFPGETGHYIDIGACHPVYDSVTKHFYERGWSGLNVEPLVGIHQLIEKDRPRDLNLNVTVSTVGETQTFYECTSHLPLSTCEKKAAEDLKISGLPIVEHEIISLTLKEICERFEEHHNSDEINFLKIDVEGHEREVIASADWERYRPQVLLVEATEPRSSTPCFEKWEHILLEANYQFALFDGLNRYYVREEDAKEFVPILEHPLSVFDKHVTFQQHQQLKWIRAVLQDALQSHATADVIGCLDTLLSEMIKNPMWILSSTTELSAAIQELLDVRLAAPKPQVG